MSIRYKIAVLYTTLTGLIVLGVGFAVYLASVSERKNLFHTQLRSRALGTANAASVIHDGNFLVLGKLDSAAVASLQNKSILVLDSLGKPVYTYADNAGMELLLDAETLQETRLNNEHFFKLEKRMAVAIHLTGKHNDLVVAVAAEDIAGKTALQSLKKLLVWAFVAFLLISFLVSILFARIMVNPLRRMISEVDMISSNNLSQRIHENEARDELHNLGKTFNKLLDRLQESFVIQRRFISNASHELSTPLTSVSSQLEVALQKDRDAAEYRQVLQSVYEDVKDLQLLTRSLLDIAKSGSQGSLELEEVRMDEVLTKVASHVQKLKSEYTVQLFFETLPENEQLLTVFGNTNLLYIAFRNIIENGCKYAEDNTAVIHISFGESQIVVTVKNIGEVIPEADIQQLFQPFFRAGSVKHKQGFGLGLTLAKRIFSLHKSTIAVSSNQAEGTVFTITLPNTPG